MAIRRSDTRKKVKPRQTPQIKSGRLTGNTGLIPLGENIKYGWARGYEQFYIKKYKPKRGTIGEGISSTTRGNKYNSFDHGRAAPRAS